MKDPFAELPARLMHRRFALLGGAFDFTSDSAQLLRLVERAYDRLPAHRFPGARPRFEVRLALQRGGSSMKGREPPPLRTQGGAGMLCGAMDAWNFAALNPQAGSGLVAMSREMLRFPYHARYELIEFAVFTLASRAQGLVPLHAACIGTGDRGLLLVGESGAGKSTLTLQCMLQGLELLAEDAVFVSPGDLLATGVPNFLHLRRDSLRFIEAPAIAAHVRRSPIIRRRSGVEKFEVDLRHRNYRIARRPLRIVGVVFVSARHAADAALLRPVSRRSALARLAASQRYASGLASWKPFLASLANAAAFELRRGKHPGDAARALRRLLEWGSQRNWRRHASARSDGIGRGGAVARLL